MKPVSHIIESAIIGFLIVFLCIGVTSALANIRDRWERGCLESLQQELDEHTRLFKYFFKQVSDYSRISQSATFPSDPDLFDSHSEHWAQRLQTLQAKGKKMEMTLDLIIEGQRNADFDRYAMSKEGKRACERMLGELQSDESDARLLKFTFLITRDGVVTDRGIQFSMNQ